MSTCSYTWKEWDEEKEKRIEKRCQNETWKGSDKFCIFHDPSPEKDENLFKEKLEEQMQAETERHNFIGYYFPENWDFSGKEFKIDVSFSGATFQGYADFKGDTFQKVGDFYGATFQKDADFVRATFQKDADFVRATFQKDAYFNGTTFQEEAYFSEATFQKDAEFRRATFQRVFFDEVTFQGDVYFYGATFREEACFIEATFREAHFFITAFQEDADFVRATFQEHADFGGATFQEEADFCGATFQGEAHFYGAAFQNADFSSATFEKSVEFVPKYIEGLNLWNTQFSFRSNITANLKKTKFHRAYLENVAFIDCEWPDNYEIYEEKHIDYTSISVSYNQLETIYRNLKQNMQNHGDYSKAGEFYYREMEMKRKGASKIKELIGLKVYKYLAGYGERYWNTAAVSGSVIFFFAFLYGITDCLQYSVENPCLNQEIIDVVYFSFVTFTTLGLGDITPLTTLGKVLICLEAVIGAFMIAVFVVVFVRKMAR